jgi:hypothetical protein
MNVRYALPLVYLALLSAAAVRIPAAQEVRELDGRMHHLGDNQTSDWPEAPSAAEGQSLAFEFQARALQGEATLELEQRNVSEAWHVAINGTRVVTLARREPLERQHYVVPAGTLRDGTNTFELMGDVPTDDITVGRIRLHERPLRAVLGLHEVAVQVRERASGAPSPARLTVLDEAGELVRLYYGERLHTAVRDGVCYTADGEARFEIPRGTYRIWATRGPEWSLAQGELTVGDTLQRVALEIQREVDTTGYIACDTHVHTLTFSGHGDSSVEERMVTLAGEGLELAVATDHNHQTDYRPYQQRMGLERHFTPVVGNEVTTPVGHFNGFPLDPQAEVPPYELEDVSAIVAGIRAKGALAVILNHPRWPDHQKGPFGVAELDPYTGQSGMVHPYDALELINSETKEPEPMSLFRDWFALLNRGERVAGVASSDSHTVSGVVGMGRNYVPSASDDPAALDIAQCCGHIAAGRTSFGMGIFATANVEGRGPGELVKAAGASELALSLRVASASWVRPQQAIVFVNGAPALTLAVDSQPSRPTDARLEQRLAVPPHDAWVVCVVTGAGVGGRFWPQINDYTLAATNPIFLDVDGDGRYSSPREIARARLAAGGDGPTALEGALEGCDEAVALQVLDLAREHYLREADERLQVGSTAAAARMERVREWLERLPQR